MKNNQTKIVIIVIAVLLVLVCVLAALNAKSVEAKKAMLEAQTFTISTESKTYEVNMDMINSIGIQDISANLKRNGKAAEEKVYQGVPFKAIIDKLSIDSQGVQSFIFTAADGYASAVTKDKAMDDKNCFVVTSVGGKALGSKENGGSGPFMMILAKEQFSQQWCKFLIEVKSK